MQRRAFLKTAVGDKYTGARLCPMRIEAPELTVPVLEGSAKLPPATNTFARPDNVTPSRLDVPLSGDAARVTIPKRSVVALELSIA